MVLRALDISQVLYHALVMKPGRGDVDQDQLTRALSELWALLRLRGIDYVLVGGVAVLQYVEGRNTEVVELILAASALEKLPELEIIDRNPYFAQARMGALRIDVLLTVNPLFARVQRDFATEREFVGVQVRCATVEGLILLKLYALPSLYRGGDFARVGIYENDIATLMHAYRPDVEQLVGVLSAYLSESDLAEVRGVQADIERRIARFTGRQSPDTDLND